MIDGINLKPHTHPPTLSKKPKSATCPNTLNQHPEAEPPGEISIKKLPLARQSIAGNHSRAGR
ncbi:hypothetical protein PSEUDO8Z_60091 [Pseudomonas sp. 8Z]|nr:hypothetical protein PSEUDO8Z_60091 [Pseudomonas sp. 8Z]